MNTAILSPGYPDIPGGVTHHTERLQSNWTAAGNHVEVIGDLGSSPQGMIDRLSSASVGAVLIQYVPFLYGRRGVSRFPERFARGAVANGMRVTVFVHEPWVPMTRLPWIPLSLIQRRQLRRLLRTSHAAVTTVPAWQDLLGNHLHIVYIGCTLGEPSDFSQSKPSLPAPVVFSPFASGLRWPWIVEAAKAIGSSPPLIIGGADSDSVRKHATVGPWCEEEGDYRGHLPADDVHELLSRARLVLCPFVDGMSGRRTSAFAATSAGARVVTSRGSLFDPFFSDSPLHVASTLEEFVRLTVSLWNTPDTAADRDRRMQWHQTHLDSTSLDARLLEIVTG